jgi:hypothetical protein
MSLFQRYADGPWNYEFILHRKRYRASTKTTDYDVALAFEAQRRQEAEIEHWSAAVSTAAAIQSTTMWDAAQSWLNKSAALFADHRGNLVRVRKLFGRGMLLIRGEWVEVNSERFGFSKTLQVHEVTPGVIQQLQDARKIEGNSLGTVDRELALVSVLLMHASEMHSPSVTPKALLRPNVTLGVAPLRPYVRVVEHKARFKLNRRHLDVRVVAPVVHKITKEQYDALMLAPVGQSSASELSLPRFSFADKKVLSGKISRVSSHMRHRLICRFDVCALGKQWAYIEVVTPGSADGPMLPVPLASVCLDIYRTIKRYRVFDAYGALVPHAGKLSTFEEVLRPVQVTVCAWTSWEPRHMLTEFRERQRDAALLTLSAPPKIAKVAARRLKPAPRAKQPHVVPVPRDTQLPALAAQEARAPRTKSPFTDDQRISIEALRINLARRICRTVTTEYGTDEGQHWAALGIESLPLGSFRNPGTLVSIVRGIGVRGDAAVMGADGAEIGEGGGFAEMLKVACFAGMRTYRVMSEGAMQ